MARYRRGSRDRSGDTGGGLLGMARYRRGNGWAGEVRATRCGAAAASVAHAPLRIGAYWYYQYGVVYSPTC